MQRKTVLLWLKGLSWVGIYGGLLLPMVFLPIVIFPFVFSKLIAFQILVGLTFPAYLLLAWMEPAYRPSRHLLYGAIGAYFLALLLSVLFAVDPARAWWGNQERMNGLFTLLHFFAWLTMTIGLVRTERQWLRFIRYEVILSVIMAGVAILQRPFPGLLLFRAGERVGGLLDNPIYMAAYQIFNLYFILWLWSKTKERTGRVLLLGAAGLDLIAFFLTQSRGGFLGLLVGLIIFLAVRGLLMKDRRARLATVAGLVAIFAGYGLLFAARNVSFIATSPFHRLVTFTGGTTTRLIAWKIAWQGFLEKPFFGWGLDNFHVLFNEKYNPQSMRFGLSETWFDRSHNTVLDVLSMTGIVGTVTFFAIFITLAIVLVRTYRRKQLDAHALAILLALPVAYFVQNLFVFDHPAAFSMSFLMYAFVIGITRTEFHQSVGAETVVTGKSRPFSLSLAVVLGCFALLLIWRGSVLPFRASQAAIQANNYFSANLLPEAHAFAIQASERPTMYLDEQTFLLVRNLVPLVSSGSITSYKQSKELIDLTKKLLAEEIARHPKSAYTIYLAARFYQETARLYPEDIAKTDAFYRQAIALSEKRQQFWYSLADFYQRSGRIQQSLEIQKQLLTFDPAQGQPAWIYGVSLAFQQNQKKEGAEYMRNAMKAQFPYDLTDVRELLQLVDAYQVLQDKEGLKSIPRYLQPTSNSDPSTLPVYLEIAHRLEREGLIETKQQVLDFANKYISSSAQTSYDQGVIVGGTKSVTPTAPPVTKPTTSVAPVASTSGSGLLRTGGGPRR
jgi:O-antigen ligase/tetratricopeptide (TPR) repeat protein